jgi:predicted PurR-regulated permease PerM
MIGAVSALLGVVVGFILNEIAQRLGDRFGWGDLMRFVAIVVMWLVLAVVVIAISVEFFPKGQP